MKAQSASLNLYHIDAGFHRVTCAWHDSDHKPEVLGTVPGVFVSQRWVTPPEWVALRPPNDLPFGGGEYINLYWTTSSSEERLREFTDLGDRMTSAGRMVPLEHMHKTWPPHSRASWVPETAESADPGRISPEGVLASPAMTGLIMIVDVARDPSGLGALGRWHSEEFVPTVLTTGMFAGAVKLVSDSPGHSGTTAVLYYVDDGDPGELFTEYRRLIAGTARADPKFAEYQRAVDTVLETVACPSIGRYDIYE